MTPSQPHTTRYDNSFWEARGHSGDFRGAYLVGGAAFFFSKRSAAAARCSVLGMQEGRVCNDGTRHQLAFSQTKAVTAAGGGAHVVLLVVPHELERNGTERNGNSRGALVVCASKEQRKRKEEYCMPC